MAPIAHHQLIPFRPASLLLILLYLLPAAMAAAAATVSQTKGGFSFQLIHRDSPRSPFYPGNLTATQRLRRLVNISSSRDLWLKSAVFGPEVVNVIRPRLIYHPTEFMVIASFGTGPSMMTYHLSLDTGSEIVWTQCQPCPGCFPQAAPIFDPNQSPTWHTFLCPHPHCAAPYRCNAPTNGLCLYTVPYGDGSSVTGLLSTDTLSFLSGVDGSESIPNVVFGCTHRTSNFVSQDGYPEGVFGMSRAPLSFAMQLKESISGRFSYCLPPPDVTHFALLRFGDDIPMSGPVQRVPFADTNRAGLYYVDLLDLSLNNHRLMLPAGTFARRADGGGGFLIDSGSALTRLIRPAYDFTKTVLAAYFDLFNLPAVDPGQVHVPLDLCYLMPGPEFEENFPGMTLHFQGAELVLLGEDLFAVVDDDVFCWAVMPSDDYTLLGAEQQHDIRFMFDLVNEELLFVREDCSKDL